MASIQIKENINFYTRNGKSYLRKRQIVHKYILLGALKKQRRASYNHSLRSCA
jgi:hypothetical protein